MPAKPCALELLVAYACPHCGRTLHMIAPTRPGMVRCDACGDQFPVVPVEERTLAFLKIMLANGAAAVDSDFM